MKILGIVLALFLMLPSLSHAQNKNVDRSTKSEESSELTGFKIITGAGFAAAAPAIIYWAYSKDVKEYGQYLKNLKKTKDVPASEILKAEKKFAKFKKRARVGKKLLPLAGLGVFGLAMYHSFSSPKVESDLAKAKSIPVKKSGKKRKHVEYGEDAGAYETQVLNIEGVN